VDQLIVRKNKQMKKFTSLMAILLSLCWPAKAQVSNQLTGAGAPTGSCTSTQQYLDTTNHVLYYCNNNAWSASQGLGNLTGGGTTPDIRLVNYISVLDPKYGAKGDARAITFSVSALSATITGISPATMTSADVGKLIYGGNSGISGINKATVATILSPSSVTVTGATGNGTGPSQQGFVGTDDRAALRAACAASTAAAPLQIRMPAAFYMVSDGNFCPLTTAANGATALYGDGMDQTQIVYPPNDTTVSVLDIEDSIASVHDFSVDPGYRQDRAINQSPVTMNTKYAARLRSNNFNGTSGGACFGFSVDGSQIDHPEAGGCNSCIYIASQPMTIIDPQLGGSGTNQAGPCIGAGIYGFDAGGVIIGGRVQSNGTAFQATAQGAAAQYWIYGTALVGTVNAVLSNGTGTSTNTVIYGASLGCPPAGNSNGVNIATGNTVSIVGSQICSAGTGFGILNNAGGVFKDLCGNFFTSTGAGNYSGAGTIYNCLSAPINPKCLVASGASPAACASASQGKLAVPATTTTYTVNTTAITANSTLLMFPTQDNSGITGAPTCAVVATPFAQATARVAGTSFTFSLPSNAGISCFEWTLQN
jgi:hypothetical protein